MISRLEANGLKTQFFRNTPALKAKQRRKTKVACHPSDQCEISPLASTKGCLRCRQISTNLGKRIIRWQRLSRHHGRTTLTTACEISSRGIVAKLIIVMCDKNAQEIALFAPNYEFWRSVSREKGNMRFSYQMQSVHKTFTLAIFFSSIDFSKRWIKSSEVFVSRKLQNITIDLFRKRTQKGNIVNRDTESIFLSIKIPT